MAVVAAFQVGLCGLVMLSSLSLFRMLGEILSGTRAERLGRPVLACFCLLASLTAFIAAVRFAVPVIEAMG